MVASSSRKPLVARFLDICTSVSTFWRAVTSAVIGLAALLVAGWILTVTLGPQPVLIAEPSLPPALLQHGYSPEVIVRRVLDDVTRLREAAALDRSQIATFESAPSTPPPHLQSLGGISLASVEYALRVLLGRPPVVVQGEVITKADDSGVTLYEGRLRLGTVIISSREGRLATPDLDKLIQDLAFDLYRHFDPLRAAYAAWNLDDIEDMRIALRQLLASPRPEDRKYALMLRANIVTPAMAEADLREAIRIDPSFVYAIALLAELERRRGALDSALRHAEQATAVAPSRGLGPYFKGKVQRAQGDLVAALATLDEACRLEPRLSSCLNQRGEVLLEMSLRSDNPTVLRRRAYEAFLAAFELDKLNDVALSNAAWAAAAYGDLSEALLLSNAAIELAPRVAGHRLRQAWILKRSGAMAEARAALAATLALNPDILQSAPAQPWDAEWIKELAAWTQ